jgi:hypothetical protein
MSNKITKMKNTSSGTGSIQSIAQITKNKAETWMAF